MNITDENAQKLIIIAALVTLGSTTYASYNPPPGKKPPKLRRAVIGGVLAMVISSVIAEFDPKLGVLLAGLVATGTFIEYSLPSFIEGFGNPREKQEQLKEVKKGR